MSTRTALAAVALMLAVTPALGAVVAEPPSDARAGGGVFEPAGAVEPVQAPRDVRGLAEATMAAPLPAGVTAVGAALLGLGLVYRRRG